jgi:hypothetical protein
MSIVRVHKEKDFVTVANRPFRDRRMSWEARGLLGFLLTKPDDWEVDTENLVRESPNAKRDKVLSMLKELEVFGHLHRQRVNGEGGQMEWQTVIYESSSLNPHFDPDSVAPYPEIPATADSKTRAKPAKVVRAETASPSSAKPVMVEGAEHTEKPLMVEGESPTNAPGPDSVADVSPSTAAPALDAPALANPALLRKIDLEEILEGRITDEKEILSFVESKPRLARAQMGVIAFRFWQIHLAHPQAIFNAKRQRAVDDRLKEGYELKRILLAIRGCKLSPHNMGENDRHEIYDALDLICRNGSQVERFEAKALAEDATTARLARRAAEQEERAAGATAAGPGNNGSTPPVVPPRDDKPATDEELEHYASNFFKAMKGGGYTLVTTIINRLVAEWRAANKERDAKVIVEWQKANPDSARGGEMTSAGSAAPTVLRSIEGGKGDA